HTTQIRCHRGDAIRFFYTQLSGVANLNAAISVGRNGGEHGKLVDEQSRLRARDLKRAQRAVLHFHCADEFAVLLFQIDDAYANAESGEDIEDSGAGGVKP